MAGMKSYIGRKCCSLNTFVKNLLVASSVQTPSNMILLETGDYILLETGFKIPLET